MAIQTKDSEISKTEYQVFLCFRGPDTRQGFTDILFDRLKESGIHVFKDDNELRTGDKIESILEAINNSKICVPIFSKTFASSDCCLREVAKMVKLQKQIVPIFYDVTPDDVKLKTPLYVDQMKQYESGEMEELEKALMEVGRIKGLELKKQGFAEFRNKFCEDIVKKLSLPKYIINHFVEMPDEVEEAMKLLEIGSANVRFLGMYGMGGIGKTTLARIIFNQISSSFDSCSFLENIREERSSKGIESLRTKLLLDLHPKTGSKIMNFRLKSVLIVLDDVGERSDIEELVGDSASFGSGSRIIITTRDTRALSANMPTSCYVNMEVKGMNDKQALQLFSRCAFESDCDCPPEDYLSLSRNVVSISGGLPLALEVIGSLLKDMSIEAWKDKVIILKTIPEKKVREKLMISYNILEDNVKEIFLDIACFFIHADKANPIYMWEACDLGPNWALQILLRMSLIKITDDDKFWMHDQLRDMGREIIRIKGNDNLTYREGSRIHTYQDLLFLQQRNKLEKEVVGLRVHGVDVHLTKFSNLERLRFLQVLEDAPVHHSKFWQLPTNLRWLSLMLKKSKAATAINIFSSVTPNRNNPYMMKLVVLDLSGSDITDNWDGWILIQELQKLKVLNLTRCKKLSRTPDFSKMETLEKLSLCRCVRLTKLDSSIGKLRKLKYLNLENCYKLKELPEEIGNLENLEEILMTDSHVSKLSDPRKLPRTIGLLVMLKQLELSSPILHELADSTGDLIYSVVSKCSMIKELPSSITRLEKLERLTLNGCVKLVELPVNLGNMNSLVELDLSCTSVTFLPESIVYLTRLQVIDLSWSTVRVLPETIAQLSLLQKLDLYKCSLLERVPELPTSLTDLKLNVCSLIRDSDLSNLDQLVELTLDDGELSKSLGGRMFQVYLLDDGELPVQSLPEKSPFKFDAMEALLKLESLDLDMKRQFFLPVEFSALTRLKSLKLSCSNLMCIPPLPSSLQSLTLRKVGGETKLSCLSNLNILSELELKDWRIEGGISNLEVDKLESLTRLSIHWGHTISKLPDLSRLNRLEELYLYDCPQLVDIPGLGAAVSLQKLLIQYCDSLERLENIQNLMCLRHIRICYCKNFTGIQGLEKLNVSKVEINNCKCKDIS